MSTNDTSPMQPGNIQITHVELKELHASPTNPRKHFSQSAQTEMMESIRQHGIQTPLLVRRSPTQPGMLEIVAGERRFRGLSELLRQWDADSMELTGELHESLAPFYESLRLVPVILRELSDATVLELQLVENLQREGLTPLEEAEGYKALLELKDGGYTPAKIAEKIGKKRVTVLFKLRMLDAPQVLRDALERGQVGERHLFHVASIPGVKQREECAKKVLEGVFDFDAEVMRPLTARETEALVNSTYRRTLKGVAFDLADAELVAEAGPCVSCPFYLAHAMQADPALAESVGGSHPLTCLNPSCLERKNKAYLQRKEKEARAAGDAAPVVVLKADEAADLFDERGGLKTKKLVRLDERPGYDLTGHFDASKTPTWREMLADQLPPVQMANVPGVGIVEAVDATAALAVARASHADVFKPEDTGGKADDEAARKQKEKDAFEKKVAARTRPVLLTFLHAAALEKPGVDMMRAVFESALYEAGTDGNRLLCDWLKLEPKVKKGAVAAVENYRAALVEHAATVEGRAEMDALVMLAVLSKWVKAWGVNLASLAPLQKHFGFDAKTIQALAKAELAAEKKPGTKPGKKAAKNSTDAVDIETDKEADKTAAADAIGKLPQAPPSGASGRVFRITDAVDMDAAVAALKRGAAVADVIGSQPNRKENEAAYKKWNSLRMKLQRKAGVAK